MSDDSGVIPRHVGLILDGNGRWANARGLPRTAGHQAGEATLFEVIRVAGEIGVEWLTAFTFSTENWNRSEEEVAFLMWFNEDILIRRREDLHAWGMRIHFAGDTDDPRIPERNREHMAESVRLTAANSGMNVVFAFNYGSRWEIVEAARRVAADAATGRLAPEDLDAGIFQRYLAIRDMPDVDLVIRSSGEHRVSNFLLWQAAYAEFYFPGILWPDFDEAAFREAIAEYGRRNRRFGGAIDAPGPGL